MNASKPAGKLTKTGKNFPTHDRAHDVLHAESHPLDAIFSPHSVAVIGATDRPGSVGRAVVWSLVSSPFGGTVYPVSQQRTSVLGIPRSYIAQGRPDDILASLGLDGPGIARSVRELLDRRAADEQRHPGVAGSTQT